MIKNKPDFNKILQPYKIPKKLGLRSPGTNILTDRLVYFGVVHTKNPKDRQFIQLDKYLNKFHKTNPSVKKIILIEGKIPPYNNLFVGIPKYGENAFLLHWAKTHKLPIKSIEPSTSVLLKSALNKHERKQVLFWIYLNLLVNKQLNNRVLENIFRDLKFPKKEYPSLQKYLLDQISHLKRKRVQFHIAVSPFSRKLNSNKISITINNSKDRYMAANIIKYMDMGYKVFCVAHISHVFAQSPIFTKK